MKTPGRQTATKSFNSIWLKSMVFILLGIWSVLLVWKTSQTFSPQLSVLSYFFKLSRFGSIDTSLFISHWLGTAKVVLMLVGMLLTAYGLGSFIGKKLGLTQEAGLRSIVIILAVGLASMSLLSMLIGFAQLYYNWLLILLTIAGALYGSYRLWRERQQFGFLKQLTEGPFTLLDYGLIGLTLLVLLFVFLNTNTPELFFDSLVYHLAVPQQYLMNHGIKSMPTMFFSNMPFGIEMLYAWALSLADERLCRMLHAFLGVLTGLLVFITARKFCQPRYVLWAACLFLIVPVVNMNMLESGVDVGSAFFGLVAFDALLEWFYKKNTPTNTMNFKSTLVTGLFIGMALLCKYTTAFILAPAVLLSYVLLLNSKQYTWKQLIKPLMIMSVGVFIILSPLFIKNALFTNNPVYPFLFKMIPSQNIHAEKMRNQMHEFKEFGNRNLTQYLMQPWTLSFYYATSNSFIGVIFLFLMPAIIVLGWVNRRGPPLWKILFWSTILGTLIWTTQTQITRYYIPIIPMLCILCAALIEKWMKWHALTASIVKLVIIILGVWCSLLFIGIGIGNWDPSGVALGLESRNNYLNRKLLNSYINTADVVNKLPVNSKIMIFGDTRSYYYKRQTTVATVFDHHPLIVMFQKKQTAEQIWQDLKKQGYTHLVVHHDEAQRIRGYETYNWDEQAVAAYQKLITYYMKPLYVFRQQVIYKLRDKPNLDIALKEGKPLFTESFDTIKNVQALLGKIRNIRGHNQTILLWKQIQKLVPNWWVPYHVMARQYYQLKQFKEAFNMYTRSEGLGWIDPAGYLFLGNSVASQGDFLLARRYFIAVLQQEPNFIAAKQGLEQINRLLGNSSTQMK